jgi:flagellar biosynthesis/type III secretory pathway protein FliH
VSEIVKKAGPSSSAPPKVVPREVIAASSEALRIVETAEAEAAQIRASAEAVREEARRKGYAEGYEKGAGEWGEAVRTARASVAAAVEGAKPQIVRLALRVAEKVLRRKLETEPESLLPMVDEALRSLSAQQPARVVIRAHPDDRGVLEVRRQHWLDRNPGLATLQVVADESFPRGGCRIESDFGMVDASLDTQLRVIERHLLGEGER